MEQNDETLRGVIIKRIDRWLEREAARVRDDDSLATIKFTISNPGGDDNNTLTLNLVVEETSQEVLGEEAFLTVPGLAFE